jgi:Na+-driven multidrug efflux pump
MVLITLASFLFSENIVLMFGNDAAEALSTAQRGYFLIFGLLFTLSEGWGIVLCGAIRGLGDTDYIMKVSTIASVSALMLLVLSFSLGAPVFILWILLALNSSVKAAAFCLRYLKSGRWIKISATEHNN